MARKKSVKITVNVPAGVKIAPDVLKEAAAAAQNIVDSKGVFATIAADLAKSGISISAAELMKRHTGGKVAAPAAAGKKSKTGKSGRKPRTTLSGAQRKDLIGELRKGATASSMADKYGCSIQTVRNIKKAAGLVKKKVAKKKK